MPRLDSEEGFAASFAVSYSTRVKLGISLFVFVMLFSAVRQAQLTLRDLRTFPPTDGITEYEQRFTAVKRLLPPHQIIFYRDEFDKKSGQCGAFVLAQYALAPSVLAAYDSSCRSPVETSPQKSSFLLVNLHDPHSEPYLIKLFEIFSGAYFPSPPRPVPADIDRMAGADRLVLLSDNGHGVRLYSRGNR